MDGEIKLTETREVLGEKSVPVPLCPPPVAYGHAPNRNICKRLFACCKDRNKKLQTYKLDFCLTVHHQLGKIIQMSQLDATMI